MRNLTETERETFYEQGYVVVPDVFPGQELGEIDRELDRIQEKKRAQRGKFHGTEARGWIMSLGLASPMTRRLCADERLLNLVQDIVHPGIAIYSAKMVAKKRYSTEVCHWHQDDAYYSQKSQSRTRMSIWFSLQDTTPEQGCLQVIPGSHNRGLQPCSQRRGGTCTLGIDTEVDLSERVYCPVQAGSVILFSALLWHASEGNQTGERRRAFIVSYQEATVKGGNGAQWKILRPAS